MGAHLPTRDRKNQSFEIAQDYSIHPNTKGH